MTESDAAFVSFMKKVGIICGAVIAAGTVLQFLGTAGWALATRSINAKLDALAVSQVRLAEEQREERIARQYNDSLMVQQIAKVAESMYYPLGSTARERALGKAVDAPKAQQRQQQHDMNERRR